MTIQALPTPPSRTGSPADFASKADALLGALPTFVTEVNTTQSDLNAKKADFDTKYSSALAVGLASAPANAAAATSGAATATQKAAEATAAADAANAAWAAALAANPDLNPVFRANPSTIATNTTLPAGYNAYSAGPLAIAEDVSITIEDHAHWTII